MTLSFGEKIKESRKAKNLTQKELATLIGAKHNSISDWENNKNKPDPDAIELLCGILEITPNYLLSSSENEFSPIEKRIIENYRSLDPYGQETVDIVLNRETERVRQIRDAQEGTDSKIIRPRRFMTYYNRIASAGNGEYLFEDLPTDTIEVPDSELSENADFVIGVNGDSMEPTYHSGDKVYVEKRQIIETGEIGVFILNNQCYIKEAGEDGLISHNPKYNIIPGTENIFCVGRVLGRVENTEDDADAIRLARKEYELRTSKKKMSS